MKIHTKQGLIFECLVNDTQRHSHTMYKETRRAVEVCALFLYKYQPQKQHNMTINMAQILYIISMQDRYGCIFVIGSITESKSAFFFTEKKGHV